MLAKEQDFKKAEKIRKQNTESFFI